MPERMLEWSEPKKLYSQNSFTGKHRGWRPFLCSWRHMGLHFFQKETLPQMLFYENWEVLENIIITEQYCVTASDFLWHLQCITLPSRMDVTSRQLIFWEFSTHNSVISATTFIKNGPNFPTPRLFQATRLLKSRNQVVQLPTAPLFQPPDHSKLENVFDFQNCENKTVKCMTMHTEK